MISKTLPGTFALALGVLMLAPALVPAQTWPNKPIRMIVPFPPEVRRTSSHASSGRSSLSSSASRCP